MPFPAGARLLLGTYDEQYQSVLARTDVESGIPKQSKFKSLQPVERRVTYRMTASEYVAWLDWYRTEINYGATPFTWADLQGVDRQVKILRGEFNAKPVYHSEGSTPEYEVTYVLEAHQ